MSLRNSKESDPVPATRQLSRRPCGRDGDGHPCSRVKKSLHPPCQRVLFFRVRFLPARANVALSLALLSLFAFSGRSSPLVDRLFGLAADGQGQGQGQENRGILSEDLLRRLAEVKFDDGRGEKKEKKNPKVAFLFLIRDSVAHQDMWTKWFESSSEGDWRDRANVYVHIKPGEDKRPRTTIPDLAPLFCDRVIPSVRTKWFFLHHAMMQLLLYSYIQRDNMHFVFVSDSSVPLKSFDQVYDELVNKDARSRICHADPGEGRGAWKPMSTDPRVRGTVDIMDMSKASLWSSYSRSHVRYLLENAETLADWYGGYMDAPSHRWGAADEMLLPTLLRTHVSDEELSDCHGTTGVGGPLPMESSKAQKQSRALAEREDSEDKKSPSSATVESRRLCCPHAEKWGDGNKGEMTTYPRTGLSPLWDAYECVGGPCEYTKLNHAQLKDMTQMESVMFLRKVARDATILNEDQKWVPIEEALGGLLGIKNGSKGEEPKVKHFCAVNH